MSKTLVLFLANAVPQNACMISNGGSWVRRQYMNPASSSYSSVGVWMWETKTSRSRARKAAVLKRANSIKARKTCSSKQAVGLSAGRARTEMYVLVLLEVRGGRVERNYMCGEAVALVTGCRAKPPRAVQVHQRGYEGSLCLCVRGAWHGMAWHGRCALARCVPGRADR